MTLRNNEVAPPPVIDSARTICYAVIDDNVVFTDRICLSVDGEKLGEVPCLAICENYYIPGDVLLLFCDSDWNSKGAIAFKSVEEAKSKAEKGYQGISTIWVEANFSKEETDKYLREVYRVDPDTKWWVIRCSFCGEDDVEMLTSEDAQICHKCIKQFYKMITEENNG